MTFSSPLSPAKTAPRPLLQPTFQSPLAVDATGAMPALLYETLHQQKVVQSTASNRWYAFACSQSSTSGNTSNTKIVFYLTHQAYGLSLLEQKVDTQSCCKLTAPVFLQLSDNSVEDNVNDDGSVNSCIPLMQLLVSPYNNQQCSLYAIHPTRGTLVWWNISQQQLKDLNVQNDIISNRNNNNNNSVGGIIPQGPLHSATETLILEDGEVVTCLSVATNSGSNEITDNLPKLVVGTSHGRLFLIVQATHPVTLKAQLIQASTSSSSTLSTSSYLSRLFGGGGSKSNNETSGSGKNPSQAVQQQQSSHRNKHAIKSIQWQDQNFVSFTQVGLINTWQCKNQAGKFTVNQITTRSFDLKTSLVSVLSNAPQLLDLNLIRSCCSIHSGNATDDTTNSSSNMRNQTNYKIHCLVKTRHDAKKETRLYWVVLEQRQEQQQQESNNQEAVDDFKIVSAIWLNRYYAPQDVQVLGMAVSSNQVPYAILRAGVQKACVVTSVDENNTLHELELALAQIPSIYPNTLISDMITHGCTFWSTSGLGLCVSFNPAKLSATTDVATPRRSKQLRTVLTIQQHLQSTFRHYCNNPNSNEALILPPSVTSAKLKDVEGAVVAVAQELSDCINLQVDTSNPLEQQWSLRSFLEQTGLYRRLSELTRWQLLAIAQHVAVLWQLAKGHTEEIWEVDQKMLLTSQPLEEWLYDTQEAVLTDKNPNHHYIWASWLCDALDVAATIRSEVEQADKLTEYPPLVANEEDVPVWTSNVRVQNILGKQIDYWLHNDIKASREQVEKVVKTSLQSFADSYHACPNSEKTRKRYGTVASNAMAVWKEDVGDSVDDQIWVLSQKHGFFSGLCHLAWHHSRRSDKDKYNLVPLLEELSSQVDTLTQLKFGEYCLVWHLDRGYLGHVLEYGKYVNEYLQPLLETNEKLRLYRWIGAARLGQYNKAAEYLMENVEIGQTKLKDAKLALSLALIASQVAEEITNLPDSKQAANKQKESIEKLRELVVAQEMLDSSQVTKDTVLKPAVVLLNEALNHSDEKDLTFDDRVNLYFIALAICTTLNSSQQSTVEASKVWSKAVAADLDFWTDMLNRESRLTDPVIKNDVLRKTVFGGLVQQCMENADDKWRIVLYGGEVERKVVSQLYNSLPESSLQKVLRIVTPEQWHVVSDV